MTEQTLMRLLDAGFEKSEIMQLAGVNTTPVSQTVQTEGAQIVPDPEPTNETTNINNVVTQPELQTPTPKQSTVTMSDAQFTQLMQSINQTGASIDVPPKYDIKNVLGEHFKDLMIGG